MLVILFIALAPDVAPDKASVAAPMTSASLPQSSVDISSSPSGGLRAFAAACKLSCPSDRAKERACCKNTPNAVCCAKNTKQCCPATSPICCGNPVPQPGHRCCPTAAPACCPNNAGCCPSKFPVCFASRKLCCPTGWAPCSTQNRCCPKGQNCCGKVCCVASATCCGGKCCAKGHACCNNICCAAGQSCCGGKCCATGHKCCSSVCCAAGATCCNNKCCAIGQTCCGNVCCHPTTSSTTTSSTTTTATTTTSTTTTPTPTTTPTTTTTTTETTATPTTTETSTTTTTTPTTTPSTTTAAPCADGWTLCQAAGKCYKWVDGTFKFADALIACRNIGGTLATVDSAAATQCLLAVSATHSLSSRAVWIGLTDSTANTAHAADCACWHWLDGTAYSYHNFAPGEPSGGTNFCVNVFLGASQTLPGTWNDERCDSSDLIAALCSVPANLPATTSTSTTPTTTTKAPCPAPWIPCPNADHCYLWADGVFTQHDAQVLCSGLGGNLATINSAAATQCLIGLSTKNSAGATRVWIGLFDNDATGSHSASCTCWKWFDGTPYSYNNFAPGEPSTGLELCVDAFLAPSGKPVGTWNDEGCSSQFQSPALCSIPVNIT